ncbi:reprolysin-like metallopeptidase [Gillisia hiemivivida]|uniref:Uncharacterized protein n=1 Tax=Gillisia hiemivivida TaxID=291190 RepID=A0A5C7A1R5_9FLAO|nr:hypothetical protein ES724_01220 [Gillisia hiemivivida]
MRENRKRYRIFFKLEEHLEVPMFLLAIGWLILFIIEIFRGLSPFQEKLIYLIWILFILEFLIKIIIAPRRSQFIKHNWITVISLIIPALRVFRMFNALRILRTLRVINSTKIIRAITSGKRFFGALDKAQGPQPNAEMDVGFLIAVKNLKEKKEMIAYANQLAEDVKPELEESTGIKWNFVISETFKLDNDRSRNPSFFLDRASMSMAEGNYDLVCVLTDIGLMSRRNVQVSALSSSIARIVALSTRQTTSTGKNRERLDLNSTFVRYNSASLFLHQIGHILGLNHSPATEPGIMSSTKFDRSLSKVPSFSSKEKKVLKKKAKKAPDRELRNGNDLETFIFHILMTFRHLGKFFWPLIRNKALLLPLSLPGLATAAVAPAIILIFNAEIWDVGLGMTNGTAAFFAIISIMLASFYLVRVQSLFLPKREKRIITEHLAVANTVIYFSIFLACIGLFLMVGALMMVIELYVFPEDLMRTWPTLSKPEILLEDKIRIAVFISTVGVTTGALAGGLESRTIIQHLALFRKNE